MSNVKCAHCLTGFPERNALYYEAGGERKAFCCNGCLGVYRVINNEGLGEFYNKPDRSKTALSPPEQSILPEVGAFEKNVRLTDGPVSEVDIYIDHIRCASCVWLNEKALTKLKGVIGARVNYSTHKAVVRWDANLVGLKDIVERIIAIGYRPRPYSEDEAFKAQSEQKRDLLIRFGTAAFLSSQLTLYSVALYAGYFQGMEAGQKIFLQIIAMGIATPVVFYCGFPFIKAAMVGLRRFYFNMDSLIAAGALSAYLYSVCQIFNGAEVYFDTASMIITIILLGRYIELSAKAGASQAIRRLAELLPNEARVINTGDDVKTGSSVKVNDDIQVSDRVIIAVGAVLTGQLVEVLPGQRIPLDGKVVEGASEVDESIITGESKPVSKDVGATVIGGTLNLYRPFIFRVTNVGKETVVAKIIKAVEDAQAGKPRIQTLADRLVGHFVKAVLFIAAVTLWYHLIWSGESTGQALMAGISVVVIACPCSL
ncbi:MAG: heavy metal translocating P-type ATPase, partial [Nitrospirae bacterium]|nr:heavy metal translocating P-type ATPase [Nitrospirota bacterium]